MKIYSIKTIFFFSQTSLTSLTQLSKAYPSIILTAVVLKLQKHLQKGKNLSLDVFSFFLGDGVRTKKLDRAAHNDLFLTRR